MRRESGLDCLAKFFRLVCSNSDGATIFEHDFDCVRREQESVAQPGQGQAEHSGAETNSKEEGSIEAVLLAAEAGLLRIALFSPGVRLKYCWQ